MVTTSRQHAAAKAAKAAMLDALPKRRRRSMPAPHQRPGACDAVLAEVEAACARWRAAAARENELNVAVDHAMLDARRRGARVADIAAAAGMGARTVSTRTVDANMRLIEERGRRRFPELTLRQEAQKRMWKARPGPAPGTPRPPRSWRGVRVV